MRARNVRILLVGPLPPPMGGNTRHFETLVEDLNLHGRFSVKLINTSRGEQHSRRGRNLLVALKTLLTVVSCLRDVDVLSYHASNRGMLLFGPVIVALGKLTGKPTVLRIFGGSFGDLYRNQNGLVKAMIRKLILSSDIVLLQTQRSIRQLEGRASGKLVWFSTYIKMAAPSLDQVQAENCQDAGTHCTRFVYLGHLWRVKGVETMLDAASQLPGGTSIDIYGPLDEYTPEQIRERGMERVRYRGLLSHREVESKLWEYDCLVLPTFHRSEGYPGVIAEAFAHGLPVITTNWLAIPEIVDEHCGILIEPGDTRAFVAAVAALHQDRARWLRLKEGARRQAGQFEHAVWSRKFEEICEQLVAR
jgi:glycosyltransferase involved in cell wall biosynthesis